jgi:hypothetical protein
MSADKAPRFRRGYKREHQSMRKFRLRVCIGLLFLVMGGILAALLEPTQTVRGYFAGDAFYRGRPTRYWREYRW